MSSICFGSCAPSKSYIFFCDPLSKAAASRLRCSASGCSAWTSVARTGVGQLFDHVIGVGDQLGSLFDQLIGGKTHRFGDVASAPGPRGIFPEDGVQSPGEEIPVRFRKDQRWAQLEDVVMRTVRAG